MGHSVLVQNMNSRLEQSPNRKLLGMAAARYRWSERAVGSDDEAGRILAKIPRRLIQPKADNSPPPEAFGKPGRLPW